MSTTPGVTYNDTKSLPSFAGHSICKALPAFYTLTGCDYTMPFYGRSKFTVFKKVVKHPISCNLLLSVKLHEADEEELLDFVGSCYVFISPFSKINSFANIQVRKSKL